jgi:hypothetical protein
MIFFALEAAALVQPAAPNVISGSRLAAAKRQDLTIDDSSG